MADKKMTRKEWCKEFAPDMGYRFAEMTSGKYKYYLYHPRMAKSFGFNSLVDVQNHILRDIQRHIGKHTIIVPARRK